MSAARRLVVAPRLAVVVALVALAGCGGGDGEGARQNDPPQLALPTTPEDLGARARELVTQSYPSTVPAWIAKYTLDWGATPQADWSAEKLDDGTYVARLALSVAEGERVDAEWGITAEQLTSKETLTEPVAPRNPPARRLARFPKASPPRRGPVRLMVTILSREQGSGTLSVMPDAPAAVPTGEVILRSGRLDRPILRGFALIGGDVGTAREITVDSDTRYRGAGGRLSKRAFGKVFKGGAPQVGVSITWSSFPRGGTLESLLRTPAAKIELPG